MTVEGVSEDARESCRVLEEMMISSVRVRIWEGEMSKEGGGCGGDLGVDMTVLMMMLLLTRLFTNSEDYCCLPSEEEGGGRAVMAVVSSLILL